MNNETKIENKNNVNTQEKNFWLYSPGEKAFLFEKDLKNSTMQLGWNDLGDLSKYKSKEEISNKLNEVYPVTNEKGNCAKQTNNSKALYDFVLEMKIGDIIFAKTGNYEILGIGKVKSDYYFDSNEEYYHQRKVEWIKSGNWSIEDSNFDYSIKQLPIKTLTNISQFDGFSEAICKLICPSFSVNNITPYSNKDFLKEVVFLEKEYDNLVELIKNKKNIILEGPPGVGKTFIAIRLAFSVMGEKDKKRVEFVQFHQNYSYEEFIQGYRPKDDKFELKNGVFFNFCKKAEKDPDNDYFFIIDEINRGNISKIFGELMMLIEKDKRGKEFGIHLTYYDEETSFNDDSKFFVPKNLFIIGMMNTADRSLAMIDYALRRRFLFYPVEPLFNKDIFKEHLSDKMNINPDLVEKIIENFKKLNEEISKDPDLGEGFKIGHSYFCEENLNEEKYESIIRYEIAPLLREYWFDKEKIDIQKKIDIVKLN